MVKFNLVHRGHAELSLKPCGGYTYCRNCKVTAQGFFVCWLHMGQHGGCGCGEGNGIHHLVDPNTPSSGIKRLQSLLQLIAWISSYREKGTLAVALGWISPSPSQPNISPTQDLVYAGEVDFILIIYMMDALFSWHWQLHLSGVFILVILVE